MSTINVVEEITTDDEYKKLREDVRGESRRGKRNNEKGRANNNIHHVTVVDGGAGEDVDPAVAKVDTKLRPGSDDVERPQINFYGGEDLEDFEHQLLDDRMGWSASPFVNRSSLDLPRPEENVQSKNDYWAIDREVIDLFEGHVDFNALGDDISQANNIPKGDLAKGDRKNIDDVKTKKGNIVRTKGDLIRFAKSIIKKVWGPRGNRITIEAKSPMEIYSYVDDIVEEEEGALGGETAMEVFDDLQELLDQARALDRAREQTEDSSIEVFSDVLETPGYEFPSTVAEPDDAIKQHGVGTLDYLEI